VATSNRELPARLRELAVAPVRPLAPPRWRALRLLPIGLAVVSAAPLLFGIRPDAERLGWLLTWGASAAQATIGLWLIGLAFRESVPGRALSPAAVLAATALAAGCVALVSMLAFVASPLGVPAQARLTVDIACLSGTVLGAAPLVIAAGLLVARAFPLRPGLAGALYGLGAGILSDSGWRLFCHFTTASHVLVTHLGGVLLCGVLGALIARTWSRASTR